jgi:hypothetical protein
MRFHLFSPLELRDLDDHECHAMRSNYRLERGCGAQSNISVHLPESGIGVGENMIHQIRYQRWFATSQKHAYGAVRFRRVST